MPESRPEVANFAAAKWSSPRVLWDGQAWWAVGPAAFQVTAWACSPSINFLGSGIVFYVKRYCFITVLEHVFRCISVTY